jgi:putative ABC transport system substrate-binding protein
MCYGDGLELGANMQRRRFIGLLGGMAAWPLSARGQQSMPVIGFLSPRGPGDAPQLLASFRQGLKESDFIEGQNVAIEYRFAENQNERLPALAADLVRRQVTVIAATAVPAVIAAKAATASIPIVFEMGDDPVRLGLLAGLDRPGGNITGVAQLNREVAPKRLELLHELLPSARVVALLANPTDAASATLSNNMMSVASTLGLELHVLNASAEGDFEGVFAKLIGLRAGGLVINPDALFTARTEQLAALALRRAVPAIFESREFVVAGGLAAYGASLSDAYHLAGIYVARILKGEKPGNLPVQQATKVEFFLNLKTAKALGITVPLPLSGRADDVIE